MAVRTPTYTYGDAIQRCHQRNSRVDLDEAGIFAVNEALYKLWNEADWRETMGLLNPFYLYPAEQIYGKPTASVPTDFHGLREAYCINLYSDTLNRWPLEVQTNIEITHMRYWPNAICYDPQNQAFRLWPRAPEGLGAGQYVIDGTYKKRAPKILVNQVNQTLPWDDEYFPVFCAALDWAIARPGPEKQLLLQQYQVMVEAMKDSEALNDGDPNIAPRESFVNPFYRL